MMPIYCSCLLYYHYQNAEIVLLTTMMSLSVTSACNLSALDPVLLKCYPTKYYTGLSVTQNDVSKFMPQFIYSIDSNSFTLLHGETPIHCCTTFTTHPYPSNLTIKFTLTHAERLDYQHNMHIIRLGQTNQWHSCS